jgi:hypothetical protein
MAKKQSKQPPSQKVSSYYVRQYLKWINEGDSRAITMWRHEAPYIRQADQGKIMDYFAETLHTLRETPDLEE